MARQLLFFRLKLSFVKLRKMPADLRKTFLVWYQFSIMELMFFECASPRSSISVTRLKKVYIRIYAMDVFTSDDDNDKNLTARKPVQPNIPVCYKYTAIKMLCMGIFAAARIYYVSGLCDITMPFLVLFILYCTTRHMIYSPCLRHTRHVHKLCDLHSF